jgi:DNA-binding MltR family transcriptional regulator
MLFNDCVSLRVKGTRKHKAFELPLISYGSAVPPRSAALDDGKAAGAKLKTPFLIVHRMAIKLNKEPSHSRFLLFMAELERETDRGCALAAVAYLDDTLKELLTSRLVANKVVDELLESPTGLSAFSIRTKVAFSLGIISGEIYSDLNQLREIRNAFAHNLEAKSFAQPEIAARCANLKNQLGSLLFQKDLPPARLQFVKCVMAVYLIFQSCLQQSKRPSAGRIGRLGTLDQPNLI